MIWRGIGAVTGGVIVYIRRGLCSGTHLPRAYADGYKRNDEINKMNHYKLAEIGKDYKEGYDYIENWMKNYYELPKEISFYWREIK